MNYYQLVIKHLSHSTMQPVVSAICTCLNSILQWRFDLTMPGASLAYFVLVMFAIKTVVRNTEWWDTEYLARAGMKTNPLNAKMFMTMGNVLAQKVSDICHGLCMMPWSVHDAMVCA